MRTKAVFFDLGGTLLVMRRDRVFRSVLAEAGMEVGLEQIHTAYLKVESWWLSTYGNRKMNPEQTDRAYRDLDAKVFLDLFPKGAPEKSERIARLAGERWPELEKTIPLELYSDALPLLERLSKDGYIMALVSNAPPDTGRAVDALGLPRYLRTVIISGVVGYSKPHPEIFRIALRQSGVQPEETIHVGDLYESDVVGARNAGIDGILIDREGTQTGVDCPRIGSLAEVYDHLKR
ncbi:MAG: HAD family hydrolase [Thaumarchaeota archaeon]|nr:HAD family hydrolase [Nitrososphaerota archaeon]